MKKNFNKNLIMSEEEEHLFQQSNSCWICKKLIDNDEKKVKDHCHVTGKFSGVAHWDCNINFQLAKIVPVMIHNLRVYDSHLIYNGLDKFDVKISVIPNGLEKYLAFFWQFQFMNSSLDKLVKNLSDDHIKHLVEDCMFLSCHVCV